MDEVVLLDDAWSGHAIVTSARYGKGRPEGDCPVGDIAEVEGNRPNSLEAFDFIQTEAAIVWSGSGVWLDHMAWVARCRVDLPG
jgi:hypothetical protein